MGGKATSIRNMFGSRHKVLFSIILIVAAGCFPLLCQFGCTKKPKDSSVEPTAREQENSNMCAAKIEKMVIHSYFDAEGQAAELKRVVTDKDTIQRLAAFFPEAGKGKASPTAAGSDAYGEVSFICQDGKKVEISVSYHFDTWSEGRGDWDMRNAEEFRRLFLEILRS